MCCFLAGPFTLFMAGVLKSFDSATVFVALTDDPFIDILFRRRGAYSLQNFFIEGFEFIFRGVEEHDLDIYYYNISRGNFSMFSFWGGGDRYVNALQPSVQIESCKFCLNVCRL
jgi:hypothetical protein